MRLVLAGVRSKTFNMMTKVMRYGQSLAAQRQQRSSVAVQSSRNESRDLQCVRLYSSL